MGVEEEEEEEDMEIIVNRVEALTDAVTLEVLKEATSKDQELLSLMKEVQKGSRKTELSGYSKLCLVNGLMVRGERLVIPRERRVAVLEAAHEGCPGRDSMLQQHRVDTW